LFVGSQFFANLLYVRYKMLDLPWWEIILGYICIIKGLFVMFWVYRDHKICIPLWFVLWEIWVLFVGVYVEKGDLIYISFNFSSLMFLLVFLYRLRHFYFYLYIVDKKINFVVGKYFS